MATLLPPQKNSSGPFTVNTETTAAGRVLFPTPWTHPEGSRLGAGTPDFAMWPGCGSRFALRFGFQTMQRRQIWRGRCGFSVNDRVTQCAYWIVGGFGIHHGDTSVVRCDARDDASVGR
jgi:hypothetical protein